MNRPLNALVRSIPYARRYARALCGSTERGDRLVETALACVLDTQAETNPTPVGHRLYAAISRLQREAVPAPREDTLRRQVLLLRTLEDLGNAQAAAVVGLDEDTARRVFDDAMAEARRLVSADALIIGNDPIIATEIEHLMTQCGHRVIGIAANEDQAMALAAVTRPGLILADVRLGAGGSGRDVVARILQNAPAPVIFVSATPEGLLTGHHPEPVFVLSKPFDPVALAATSFQAVSPARSDQTCCKVIGTYSAVSHARSGSSAR